MSGTAVPMGAPALIELIRSEHLVDGVVPAAQARLAEAKARMSKARSRYFRLQLVATTLAELLEDRASSPDSDTPQLHYSCQQTLLAAQAAGHKLTGPHIAGAANVLGVSREALLAAARPDAATKQAIQQAVVPELEERLRERCEALCRFYLPQKLQDSNGRLVAGAASRLPGHVKMDLERLAREREEAAEILARRTSQELQATYAESISTVLAQLETILDR